MHQGKMIGLAVVVMLAACHPTPAKTSSEPADQMASAANTTPPMVQPTAEVAAPAPTLRELSTAASVECKNADTGDGCEAGDYDVELRPGCRRDGFFAGVSNEGGTVVIDKAPPDDTIRRATLAKGQLVCIQAIARAGQNPAWYFVTAVPADSVEACADNPLCEQYGDREIEWHIPQEGASCRAAGPGRHEGACATGWVRASELDVFSNGM